MSKKTFGDVNVNKSGHYKIARIIAHGWTPTRRAEAKEAMKRIRNLKASAATWEPERV